MIVVDTHLLGYLYLESPHSAQAEQALLKDAQWAAPRLWRSELRNVLALYLRQKQLTLEASQQIMQAALDLMAGREYEIDSNAVLRLAAASGCSAYDCEFVALAQELKVSLVTLDKQILKAFPQTAVALADFTRPDAA